MYSFSLPIIFLNLFITICGYLLIPAILCILRKELTKSQIKRIAIVNGICVCVIFMIISIETTGKSTAGGALLWPYVSYSLMKKFCQKKSDDIRPVNEQAKPEAPNSVEDVRFSLSYEGEKRTLGGSYRFDGKDFRTPLNETALEQDIAPKANSENKQDDNVSQEKEETKRKSGVKWIPLLCTILLLVFSVICNISQGVRIAELEKEPDYFVSYPDDYYEICDKAEFLDENIVFVIEGYGNYFYTYDEMMRVVEGSNTKSYGGLETSEFWLALNPEKRMELLEKFNEDNDFAPVNREFSYLAFNKEQAIALGYIAAYSH